MSTSVLLAGDRAVVRRPLFEAEPDVTVVGEACDGLQGLAPVGKLSHERLVAAPGLTNPEIGARLGISRPTAETHRASLLRRGPEGAAGQRHALKRGLLEP